MKLRSFAPSLLRSFAPSLLRSFALNACAAASYVWIIVVLVGVNSHAYEHADYTIFGKGGPAAGPQFVVSDPWDPIASPRGWLYWPELPDSTTRPGAYRRTTSNNAAVGAIIPAYFGDNNAYAIEPTSIEGDTLVYNYVYDPAKPASDQVNMFAATINAHFWVNRLHDVYWKFGFDESAGNYQHVNLTGNGVGNDRITVRVRDSVGSASWTPAAEGAFPILRLAIGEETGRHEAFDLSVIAHEYQHGVTRRLVGGNPYYVDQYPYHTTFGMFNEGWSDFAGLAITQEYADSPDVATPMFAWASPTSRRLPYSYDMSVNNQTLRLLDTGSLATNTYKSYNNAELWAGVLWDLNKVLIEKYGFAEDLIVGYDTTPGALNAGNVLAFKMMLAAMPMLPINGIPILSARNAMFAADQALTGGENLVEMWRVFARRGWGYSAQIVGAGAVEAFDLPPDLAGYLAGDFDVDGDVDGRDFLEWQRNFGSRTHFWADADLDGIVDADDLAIWQQHYGEVGGLSALAAVPEPSSVLLLISVAACFALRRQAA